MSGRYFVDTNVLMYAHDSAAGVRHERAKALIETLWRERSGVLSTQVLQEFGASQRTSCCFIADPTMNGIWSRSQSRDLVSVAVRYLLTNLGMYLGKSPA